jgi:hypothetical protein
MAVATSGSGVERGVGTKAVVGVGGKAVTASLRQADRAKAIILMTRIEIAFLILGRILLVSMFGHPVKQLALSDYIIRQLETVQKMVNMKL